MNITITKQRNITKCTCNPSHIVMGACNVSGYSVYWITGVFKRHDIYCKIALGSAVSPDVQSVQINDMHDREVNTLYDMYGERQNPLYPKLFIDCSVIRTYFK